MGNSVADRANRLANAIGIDIEDPENFIKIKMIISALTKQHNTTRNNIVRYLKNKHHNVISNTSFNDLKTLSVSTYIKLNSELDKHIRHQEACRKGYVRKGDIPLEYIHDRVGVTPKTSSYGIQYNIKSPRFFLYKETTECVCCGIKGEFYALERTRKGSKNHDWHLNLYGIRVIDGHRFEVMITQDHIVPRSKGGKHHVDNLQAMCTFCNQAKDSMDDKTFQRLNGYKNGN